MRAYLLVLLLLAGCTVERAPDPPAAAAQALTAPEQHQLVLLSFDKGVATITYSRRVEGPLPDQRAPQPLPWRAVLTDTAGTPLYETRLARADHHHALFHEGDVSLPREQFVLMVRLPLTSRPARLTVFDGDAPLAAPIPLEVTP